MEKQAKESTNKKKKPSQEGQASKGFKRVEIAEDSDSEEQESAPKPQDKENSSSTNNQNAPKI